MIKHLSIRAKLALLVIPPVAALVLAMLALAQPRLAAATRAEQSRKSAILAVEAQTLIDRLQDERGLTNWALTEAKAPESLLRQARLRTDAQRTAFTAALESLPADRRAEMRDVFEATIDFTTLRGIADGPAGATSNIFSLYTDRISTLLGVVSSLNRDVEDPVLLRQAAQINGLLTAKEQVGVMRGQTVARIEKRQLDNSDVTRLQTKGALRDELERQYASAGPEQRRDIDSLTRNPDVAASRSMMASLVTNIQLGAPPAVTPGVWWENSTKEMAAYARINDRNFRDFVDAAGVIAAQGRTDAQRFVLIGVFGVLAAVLAAAVMGRGIATRISKVTGAANRVATTDLPELLASSNSLNPDEVAKSIPTVEADASDEIGRLATSFNTVMRTAVETSIGHAQQRSKVVTALLVNLGRRNQTLIDKQLKLMDRMQSRHQDPDLLEGLFQIDHIITRMRRNAENLLVLAGEHRSRTWTEAVALYDVLRAAAQEVSDLSRIQYRAPGAEQIMVSGAYAVDLSHLIAELVENAQAFSPPSTPVILRTERGQNGLRLWIIDEGMGIDEDDLLAANDRLAAPGSVDAMTTDRIGLHVVGRLARRLGCDVRLQANPQGGTAAVVGIPDNLLEVRGDRTPPLTLSSKGGGHASGRLDVDHEVPTLGADRARTGLSGDALPAQHRRHTDDRPNGSRDDQRGSFVASAGDTEPIEPASVPAVVAATSDTATSDTATSDTVTSGTATSDTVTSDTATSETASSGTAAPQVAPAGSAVAALLGAAAARMADRAPAPRGNASPSPALFDRTTTESSWDAAAAPVAPMPTRDPSVGSSWTDDQPAAPPATELPARVPTPDPAVARPVLRIGASVTTTASNALTDMPASSDTAAPVESDLPRRAPITPAASVGAPAAPRGFGSFDPSFGPGRAAATPPAPAAAAAPAAAPAGAGAEVTGLPPLNAAALPAVRDDEVPTLPSRHGLPMRTPGATELAGMPAGAPAAAPAASAAPVAPAAPAAPAVTPAAAPPRPATPAPTPYTSAGLERRMPGGAFPNRPVDEFLANRLAARADGPATDQPVDDEARFKSLSSFQSAVIRGRDTDMLAALGDTQTTPDPSREDHR